MILGKAVAETIANKLNERIEKQLEEMALEYPYINFTLNVVPTYGPDARGIKQGQTTFLIKFKPNE